MENKCNLKSWTMYGRTIWGFENPDDVQEIFERLRTLEKKVTDLQLLAK